jgi:DNA-binding transcriptional MerR regulator
MREDYLAELTPYAHLLPDGLRHRFRMERLRKAGALLAVTQPALAAEPSRTFAPGVAEELVNNLRRMQRSQRSQRLPQAQPASAAAPAAPMATEGEYVEPVHLQIVCRDLWAGLPADRTEIQARDLQDLGDVDQALTNFYENTLARVVAETAISERTLRRWFTEELITPARTKALVYRDDERQETAGLPNAAVDLLQNAWLIRSDMRGGMSGMNWPMTGWWSRSLPPTCTGQATMTTQSPPPMPAGLPTKALTCSCVIKRWPPPKPMPVNSHGK